MTAGDVNGYWRTTLPAYDFKCEQCDKIIEVICSWKELDDQDCETCGDKMIQIIRPANVVIAPKDKATYDATKYYGK